MDDIDSESDTNTNELEYIIEDNEDNTTINSNISNTITSNNILSSDEIYIKINNNNINPYLTKFELTKLLSIRTQQIAKGSPILVNIPKNIDDPYEIAKIEFKENKCPLMIKRNNKYIRIHELINKYNY
tara:strand:+ start:909 stop:1295 length:387 start_codon:yes stop_codon:yes gene_type:complete